MCAIEAEINETSTSKPSSQLYQEYSCVMSGALKSERDSEA